MQHLRTLTLYHKGKAMRNKTIKYSKFSMNIIIHYYFKDFMFLRDIP